MKKIFLLLNIICGFAIAQTTIQYSPPANVYLSKANDIYFIGNSFTAADIFPPAVTASAGVQFSEVNLGIPGQTTTQMLARIRSVTNGKPKYVVVEGGINDLQNGLVTAKTITNNLQSMCTAAFNDGANVILLTTTPFKGNAGWNATAQAIQDTVNKAILNTITNVNFPVSTYSLLNSPGTNSLNPIYDSGDHLHPNTLGYGIIATAIYTTVGTWTTSAITPTLSVERNLLLSQPLTQTASPYFYKLYLKDSLVNNGSILSGNITSSGAISGVNILASGNSTFTGIIYTNNSVGFGANAVGGSIGNGGTSLKIGGSTSFPDFRIYTPSGSNGRLGVNNTSGAVLIGDIASMTDDGTTNLQVQSSISTPTLSVGGTTPCINLNTSGITSFLNFRNSAGSNTYHAVSSNSSSGEGQFFARSGGYFWTFYANGSERMRLLSGGQLCIANTNGSYTLNVTGTAAFSGGYALTSGTNVGNATLVAGTITVNTAKAVTGCFIILTSKTNGGTVGNVSYTISNGVSFTINSTNPLDTSTYTWMIINP